MGNSQTNSHTSKTTKLWKPDGDAYELLSAKGVTRSMPPQISQDYIFGVLEEGQANISYRGENHQISGHCFILLHPGEIFSRQGNSAHPRTIRAVIANPKFLQQQIAKLTGQNNQPPQFIQTTSLDKKVINDFSLSHRALEQASSKLEREKALQDMIALLLNYCSPEPRATTPSRRESNRIKIVRRMLLTKFNENMSLQDLAASVNLSPCRLNRIFSQEVGIPPHAFLNQIRVSEAKSRLEKGMPIAQAAVDVGFYDQAHLTRHFKRIMGYTPGILVDKKRRTPH